jgi:hypothetical protein
MSTPEQMRKTAQTLRKAASDLERLKAKREQEVREKCAATIVATVGLNKLKEKLGNSRS